MDEPTRWIDPTRLAADRRRYPAFVVPLLCMLSDYPWLGSVPSVRHLWRMMFHSYAGLIREELPTPHFSSSMTHEAHRALMYFNNTNESRSQGAALAAARSDVACLAARCPGLAQPSLEALGCAVARVAASVRSARAQEERGSRRFG